MGKSIIKALRKIPFLFALPAQCTDFDPCRTIYNNLTTLESDKAEALSVDFATGFPPADISECGAAIVSYASDQSAAEEAAEDIYNQVIAAEADFVCKMHNADDAVNHALQNTANKPVILADAQDNPGAGGTSDTTGLLESLVRLGAQKAVIAIMYDPDVAKLAHETGVGNNIHAKLGAKSGLDGIDPYEADFHIETLGDGSFTFTGDMNLNAQAELGPMALLRVIDENSEVRVIVGSTRAQCLDLAMIRHLGIEPSAQKIVAVKSTVHFRADFDPIGSETLVVISPGINPCVLKDLHYKNLRPGIRLEPLGSEHIPQ